MKRYALHAFANQITPLKRNPDHIPSAKSSAPRLASSCLVPHWKSSTYAHPIVDPFHLIRAADLLLMNLKCISISHVKRFWTVSGLYTATIEEESDRSGSLALSLAEGIHQLLEGGGALDLEEDFIVVVGNLDIEMLTLATSFWLLRGTWASVVI